MKSTKVTIYDKQKNIKLPTGIRLLVRRACHAALLAEGIEDPCEVDVSFVDDEQIRQMNHDYRNLDVSTDVLSFPMGEKGQFDVNPETGMFLLGDIVISVDHAVSQSELYGHSLQREIAFLTVHSMLHLLGYDHVNGGLEETIMREKQDQILDELGLSIVKQ